MRWSLKIATVAGIPIRIHVTFLLLVAWVAYANYVEDPDPHAVGRAVLLLLVVFGSIVLHELSHSFTARLFGVGTRRGDGEEDSRSSPREPAASGTVR